MPIKCASYFMSKHPNMSTGLLLRPYQAHLPIELFSFILQEQLPRFHTQQVRDNMNKHQSCCTGHNCRRNLCYGHDQSDRLGVCGESPQVYQMCRTT
uniref:Uncharacterized protein n=1 Tax=Arundo donax TaxID=35708 RepID=A0A0A9I0W7_ARUDO